MDDLIKKNYNSKELTQQQLNSLLDLQKTKASIFSFNPITIGLAILAISLLSFVYVNQPDTLTKIAKEVIYNHNKQLPTEYLANNMTDLNSSLTKLKFKVINSKRLSNYSTIGGRYCSIQGKKAAQIQVISNNITSTLYQSDFLDVDVTKLPYKYVKSGTTVLIWIEKSILFAMATSN